MHKWADVLRAIADGKDVQWKSFSTGEWCDVAYGAKVNPVIDTHLEWRIKPEPKPDYKVHAHLYWDTITRGCDWHSKQNHTVPVKIIMDGETNEPKSVELFK